MRHLLANRDQPKQGSHGPASGRTPEDFEIPLLANLSASEIEEVLACASVLEAHPKERLCSNDQQANQLFVIVKGRVKYSRVTARGQEILFGLLTPFQCFGLATLLPDPPHYLGTAEAVFASRMLVWKHPDIIRLADSYSQVRTNALRIALEYLGMQSSRHCRLFEGDAGHRIAKVLIDVGQRSGSIHPEGIEVQISNEQLGLLADVNRFTTSRVLSEWGKKGVITKARSAVLIHSPDALFEDEYESVDKK
jgi:CRP-like cAMP-binding protein